MRTVATYQESPAGVDDEASGWLETLQLSISVSANRDSHATLWVLHRSLLLLSGEFSLWVAEQLFLALYRNSVASLIIECGVEILWNTQLQHEFYFMPPSKGVFFFNICLSMTHKKKLLTKLWGVFDRDWSSLTASNFWIPRKENHGSFSEPSMQINRTPHWPSTLFFSLASPVLWALLFQVFLGGSLMSTSQKLHQHVLRGEACS